MTTCLKPNDLTSWLPRAVLPSEAMNNCNPDAITIQNRVDQQYKHDTKKLIH